MKVILIDQIRDKYVFDSERLHQFYKLSDFNLERSAAQDSQAFTLNLSNDVPNNFVSFARAFTDLIVLRNMLNIMLKD